MISAFDALFMKSSSITHLRHLRRWWDPYFRVGHCHAHVGTQLEGRRVGRVHQDRRRRRRWFRRHWRVPRAYEDQDQGGPRWSRGKEMRDNPFSFLVYCIILQTTVLNLCYLSLFDISRSSPLSPVCLWKHVFGVFMWLVCLLFVVCCCLRT